MSFIKKIQITPSQKVLNKRLSKPPTMPMVEPKDTVIGMKDIAGRKYKPGKGYQMPLIQGKSKKALSANIAIERSNGKPLKQAVAIAYSEQRAYKHKSRDMAGRKVKSGY